MLNGCEIVARHHDLVSRQDDTLRVVRPGWQGTINFAQVRNVQD